MITKKVHLSFDDVIYAFHEIDSNNYKSIFESAFFGYLKELHLKYNIKCSCYCFYQAEEFSLRMLDDRYQKECEQNSDWLRFGFHSIDSKKRYEFASTEETLQDYKLLTNALVKIVGKKAITPVLRLHYYEANSNVTDVLFNEGILALLTDEENRSSYNLPVFALQVLEEKGVYKEDALHLTYYQTSLRVESAKDEDMEFHQSLDKGYPYMNIFSHEYEMKNDRIKSRLETMCNLVQEAGLTYVFMEEKNLENV
jgi:hypothetical protein